MIEQKKCGLTENTQKKLITVFKKYSEIERAIIYGSRAKGNYKPGSDIDITICAPKMNLSDLLKIENQIDDLLLPYKIDISLYHHIDNTELIDHIQRVGLLLYLSNEI